MNWKNTNAVKSTVRLATKVNVFLIELRLSRFFLEQVRLGTSDMFDTCTAAHPILKREGNRI